MLRLASPGRGGPRCGQHGPRCQSRRTETIKRNASYGHLSLYSALLRPDCSVTVSATCSGTGTGNTELEGACQCVLRNILSVRALLSLLAAEQSSSGRGPWYCLFSLNSWTIGCPRSASQFTRSNFVQLHEVLRDCMLFSHLVWDFSPSRSVLVP